MSINAQLITRLNRFNGIIIRLESILSKNRTEQQQTELDDLKGKNRAYDIIQRKITNGDTLTSNDHIVLTNFIIFLNNDPRFNTRFG